MCEHDSILARNTTIDKAIRPFFTRKHTHTNKNRDKNE